jgi:hypothetical protein
VALACEIAPRRGVRSGALEFKEKMAQEPDERDIEASISVQQSAFYLEW